MCLKIFHFFGWITRLSLFLGYYKWNCYINLFFGMFPAGIQEGYQVYVLATLLNVFISGQNFLVTALESFMHRNIPYAKKNTFVSSFPMC